MTLYCPPGASRFRCQQCHNVCYTTQTESDKRAYALARRMLAGHRPDPASFAGMSSSGLILVMKAGDLVERRMARALRRDLGDRLARRYYPWLFE